MSEVKWIKLNTHMFEDEKIRIIEQMPEADTILIIWIKLLAQAGKTNASGYIFLSENIPYTDEMLATIFNRPIGTVRLALSAFKNFGMIEIDDDSFISICNWEKHQNIEGLERIREQNRLRKQRERERKKLLEAPSNDSHVTVTQSHATDIEEDKELDIDKERDIDKEKIPFIEIVSYLNVRAYRKYQPASNKTKSLINARWKEGYRLEDFKKVIDIKVNDWLNDPRMSNYLRPETLFGTKFESYLNQRVVNKNNAVNSADQIAEEYDFDF